MPSTLSTYALTAVIGESDNPSLSAYDSFTRFIDECQKDSIRATKKLKEKIHELQSSKQRSDEFRKEEEELDRRIAFDEKFKNDYDKQYTGKHDEDQLFQDVRGSFIKAIASNRDEKTRVRRDAQREIERRSLAMAEVRSAEVEERRVIKERDNLLSNIVAEANTGLERNSERKTALDSLALLCEQVSD